MELMLNHQAYPIGAQWNFGRWNGLLLWINYKLKFRDWAKHCKPLPPLASSNITNIRMDHSSSLCPNRLCKIGRMNSSDGAQQLVRAFWLETRRVGRRLFRNEFSRTILRLNRKNIILNIKSFRHWLLPMKWFWKRPVSWRNSCGNIWSLTRRIESKMRRANFRKWFGLEIIHKIN